MSFESSGPSSIATAAITPTGPSVVAMSSKRPATSPAASPSKRSALAKRPRTSYEYYEGELDEDESDYDEEEEEDPGTYPDDDEDDWSDNEDDDDEEEVVAEDQGQRRGQVQGQWQGQGQGHIQIPRQGTGGGNAAAGAAGGTAGIGGDITVADFCMSMMNMDDCHANMQVDGPADDDFARFFKEQYRRFGGEGSSAAIVLAAMNAVRARVPRDGDAMTIGARLGGIGDGTTVGTDNVHRPMMAGVVPGFASLPGLSFNVPDTINLDDGYNKKK